MMLRFRLSSGAAADVDDYGMDTESLDDGGPLSVGGLCQPHRTLVPPGPPGRTRQHRQHHLVVGVSAGEPSQGNQTAPPPSSSTTAVFGGSFQSMAPHASSQNAAGSAFQAS